MHTHEHHHHTHEVSPGLLAGRAFKIGITLNLLFVIAEVIGGLKYNSMALLTDAGHNLSDVGSLVLSLLAFILARKKATQVFTYGYKKTTVLAALTNAVILLLAVGIMAYESLRRLSNPEFVEGSVVAWIAGAGILVNGISAMLFFRDKERDLNVKSAYLHLAADALVSLGVVIGGIVIAYTGWNWVDSVLGLIIAFVILVGTWQLLVESFKLSVDAVPKGVKVEEIRDIILKNTDITDVNHIHIWPLSTTENALTVHIKIDERLSFSEKMLVIKKLRHTLQHHNVHHSTIELESGELKQENGNC
ncbi:cation diffusion facilitator family transporter [Paradesertivirga mongoliensis]|uniref:Cation diffusion facilitator family transporter n=1 Tax=Paradesertivirga mongoliensis TaxID=2100740 RepID=A0ABW4ZIY6_9SPHI|nr:cation diffusion facilitator family transporter [Pedobacter mongoliensis]